ncbi:MAG TPA: hypothetical protein VN446_04140 [Candidatus Acidoferrum sp.]|nr:hypothetical protein [Candidatus Acidoferrum sp.]
MDTSDKPHILTQDVASQLAAVNEVKYEWTLAHCGLKRQVAEFVTYLRSAMYPGVFGEEACAPPDTGRAVERYLSLASARLDGILEALLPAENACGIVEEFFGGLPEILECLATDIKAAYDGDPAALSEREIMLTYPGFEAVSIYRPAHLLYELKVPVLPRMMTEIAHSMTGIDIHPGAKIGRHFFIDHGTGVVIGETAVLGEHVTLYQGVTLGAKRFEVDESGNPVKGGQRHPRVGNHVVIYAGATVLGGGTYIGDNCVIGSGVWLTHSTKPGEKIYYGSGV